MKDKLDFLEHDLFAWLFFCLKLFIYVFVLLLVINGTYYLCSLNEKEQLSTIDYCPHCRRKTY